MKQILKKDYKQNYEKFFKEVLSSSPTGIYDESALPSYTHNNPLMSWLFWQRVNVALNLAGNLQNKSVLDFGCGGGILFKYLKDQMCSVVGCDNFSYALAKQTCDRVNLKAIIYKDLSDIKNRKFDFIFALDVLEHISDLQTIFQGFNKVAHEKTKLILSGPTENLLYKAGRLLAGFSGHYHVRNIYEIEDFLKKRGESRLSVRNLYSPFTLFRVSVWELGGHQEYAG